MGCVGCGADALVKEIGVVNLESLVFAEVRGIEMTDVGKDGVANLQGSEGGAVLFRCFPILPNI